MGKPAARLGDPTAHGGVITLGYPMVLIGGMPAARMGDMHVCPMMTPAVPPIPHVGGPILLGSPMVLIGGMPAARMGDMAMCVGPPSTILMGCPTVLIGEGGSGSASGGGAGSGAAAAAAAGAATAQTDNVESFKKIEHWVEFQFTDKAGNPVSGTNYQLISPDGKKSNGVLRPDGRIGRSGVESGEYSVVLTSVFNAKWSVTKAPVGETVKLSAEVEGFDNGTKASITILRRDISGPDVAVGEIESKIQNSKIEAEWKLVRSSDSVKGSKSPDVQKAYSAPDFYFEVLVDGCKARSGVLYFEDFIELDVKDEKGKGLANEEYVIYAPSGEVRNGKLDSAGHVREEKVPGGICSVKFPKLSRFKQS